MEYGIISNIQHYSLQDGPGIRTTVFLKGCPLRCRWCCNPETQNADPEFMKLEKIGRRMSVDEILQEVEKDEIFFRQGGGGLTVSGGEPLLQGKFTLALLTEAKRRHLKTAIETSGYGEKTLVRNIAEKLDMIYMDLKCLDPEKHRRWTGVSNDRIMENIMMIAALPCRGHFTVRTPVIPGFNDAENEIREICCFLKSLPGELEYELLPYHRLGRDKYTGLGREYPMGDVQLPAERIAALREIVHACGLEAVKEGAEENWPSML